MAANNAYPLSSNSRTKLNAFRFKNEGIPDDTTSNGAAKPINDTPDNNQSGSNGVVAPMQKSLDKGNPSPQEPQAPQAPEAKLIKECPQTPGNRIPLADLISNAEDSFDPAPGPEVTPVEHVIWQHVPASSNPSSQTPAGRRRKRRHSSSSAGSPSNGNAEKGPKEPLDLQSMQALLKTPQHDMAADLWNNYIDKNMADGADDLPPPRLANLLSSSPQTPASARTSRDSSGLRRAISCTTEFPASRAKRRRVKRLDPGGSTFQRTSSNVESGKPKPSRINYLVEKIEKSIHMAPVEMGPPGSSPLRQHIDARRCRSSSPTKDPKIPGDNGGLDEAPSAISLKNREPVRMPVLEESSSDFGDDDIDQDLMDLADASIDPFVETPHAGHKDTTLGSSGWTARATDKPTSWKPRGNPVPDNHSSTSLNPTINEIKPDEFDEFEDDYDDLPDNLQEILAKCDQKPNSATPSNPIANAPAVKKPNAANGSVNGGIAGTRPTATVKKAELASSDDEFDDEFDMEAIEQTMRQAGEGEPAHVRHS